jgi:hypothetical protein
VDIAQGSSGQALEHNPHRCVELLVGEDGAALQWDTTLQGFLDVARNGGKRHPQALGNLLGRDSALCLLHHRLQRRRELLLGRLPLHRLYTLEHATAPLPEKTPLEGILERGIEQLRLFGGNRTEERQGVQLMQPHNRRSAPQQHIA